MARILLGVAVKANSRAPMPRDARAAFLADLFSPPTGAVFRRAGFPNHCAAAAGCVFLPTACMALKKVMSSM
jgi:hypothetical protein